LLVLAIAAYAGPFNVFSSSKPASAWRVGPQDVQLVVETSESVKKPTLVVPRSLLVTTPERRTGALPAPPVVVGLTLSAAFGLGGLWLAGRGGKRVTAAVFALALLGLGAGGLFADIPDPYGRPRPRHDPRFQIPVQPPQPEPEAVAMPAQVTLPKDVRLEIVDSGDKIRLVMSAAAPAPAKLVPAVAPAAPAPAQLETPRPIAITPRR
jgi:hypothetical protein